MTKGLLRTAYRARFAFLLLPQLFVEGVRNNNLAHITYAHEQITRNSVPQVFAAVLVPPPSCGFGSQRRQALVATVSAHGMPTRLADNGCVQTRRNRPEDIRAHGTSHRLLELEFVHGAGAFLLGQLLFFFLFVAGFFELAFHNVSLGCQLLALYRPEMAAARGALHKARRTESMRAVAASE